MDSEATNSDIEFAFRYKGYCVFIDYGQRGVFAVPGDKIGPDSDLKDEEIILGNSFSFIRLIIDSREQSSSLTNFDAPNTHSQIQ